MRNAAAFVLFFALVMAIALSGINFRPGEWYAALQKPAWTPPNSVFPVAWSILYLMIAVAGWLAWRASGIGPAVVVWAIGLGINGLWSYLMFDRHDIGLALADILALWVATVAFIWLTRRLEWRAAALFLPYLAWITFAAALNFEVWRLN